MQGERREGGVLMETLKKLKKKTGENLFVFVIMDIEIFGFIRKGTKDLFLKEGARYPAEIIEDLKNLKREENFFNYFLSLTDVNKIGFAEEK